MTIVSENQTEAVNEKFKIPDARLSKVIGDCFESINGIGRSEKHNNKPTLIANQEIRNQRLRKMKKKAP